jgi:rhodanese-related sulfurtransferase
MRQSLDPHSVKTAHEAGKIHLVDVRTPAEHGEVHIAGSALMPLDRLDPEKVREQAAGRPCVLVCGSGKRAEQARQKLAASGCSPLAVLEGGVTAWEAAGLPVERGRAVMSLERQVRVAAGLLVLTGVALGVAAHPAFFGLSAFVGAGLVFAGITDWCGMGLLLARMPWNRRAV